MFDLVQRAARAFLLGQVLVLKDYSAGNGLLIEWAQVKSGATLLEGADPFELAHLLVYLVDHAELAAVLEEKGFSS